MLKKKVKNNIYFYNVKLKCPSHTKEDQGRVKEKNILDFQNKVVNIQEKCLLQSPPTLLTFRSVTFSSKITRLIL